MSGFIEPKIEREHYVLGGSPIPVKILQPFGNWNDSLPDGEKQFVSKFDTYNCTSFNTLNQIEQYLRKAFNDSTNYSDRWVGIIAGTDPKKGGNDPHVVYEAIRKYGLIPENMLPFSDDIQNVEEYYSFKGADQKACYDAGKKWLDKYDFKHEWVFQPDQPIDEKINNMKVSLKYSPLGIAVYAWAMDERGVYISLGSPNHWTSVFGYEDLIDVFDSYEPFKKFVDQNILFCKRISIELKKKNTSFISWLIKQLSIIKFFRNEK